MVEQEIGYVQHAGVRSDKFLGFSVIDCDEPKKATKLDK